MAHSLAHRASPSPVADLPHATRTKRRRLEASTAAVFALLVLAFPGQAQEPEALELADQVVAPADPAGADLSDVAALEAWLDGFMVSHLRELPTAGATIAIVREGEVLLTRGYGDADVEGKREVDPSTMFRIGSVSKLFTWTAIMQLVEQGRLDLHTDINEYMGEVQVPDTFDEPVTLAHLLTHTAGFEEQAIGLFGYDEEVMRPLAEILIDEMPARVRPPGEAASYSNHGTGMAAHIVELETGMSFAEYMQTYILDPLGMDETTILQPVPEELVTLMSEGYSDASNGEYDLEQFEFIPLAPVGAVSSSANDMAKLMLAYLQGGQLGDARILEEETALRMREPLYEPADGLNAGLHGFMDMSQDGVRIFGHGGDTFWFHTLFAMLPEHDVGVFVSYNTDTGAAGRARFLDAFLERYFPVAEPADVAVSEAAIERAERFAGSYRAIRYAESDFTKVAAAVGVVSVRPDSGAILLDDNPTRYVEIRPGLYREEEGHQRIGFRTDQDGNPTYMLVDPFQIIAFERLDGLATPGAQMTILVGLGIVFGLALLFWPIVALVRWRYKATPPREKRLPRWARSATWLGCLCLVLFVTLFISSASDGTAVVLGDLSSTRQALGLGVAGAILGVLSTLLAIWFWVRGEGARTTRVIYSIVAVAMLAAIWQMSYWNLLGFQF